MHQKAHLIGKKRSANKELCIASGCCANPVEAGLCGYSEEYRYSSAKFYETVQMSLGLLRIGWISDCLKLVTDAQHRRRMLS